jgi:hypothetical protein
MHNNSRFHQSNSKLFLNPDNLQTKEFTKKLFELGEEKCVEYLGNDIKNDHDKYKTCRQNVMATIVCVARSKANNQLGDLRDNVGNCKHEIQICEDNLTKAFANFPIQKLYDDLRDISLSTKSFV